MSETTHTTKRRPGRPRKPAPTPALQMPPSAIIPTYKADDQMMDAKQICSRLKISPATFHRWRNEGRFPTGTKLGARLIRWPAATIEAWVQSRAANDNASSKQVA